MIVLDSNVVSELMRGKPDPAVLAWLRRQVPGDLFTTAVTLAEVRFGIARLPDGHRKTQLAQAADEVLGRFPERILPFDAVAAGEYAHLVASRERAGEPMDGFDAQIAAVCRVHGAPLATRNVKDFRHSGLEISNPWESGAGLLPDPN